MTQIIQKEKLTHYDCSKPWVSQSGTDVDLEIYIEDNLMTIEVTLGWDNFRDEIEIIEINETYTDCDGNEISSEHIDIEHLVDEILKSKDVYGIATRAMIADYHDAHA